jgi:predicted DNA-binding transcriptional regulator AlpA
MTKLAELPDIPVLSGGWINLTEAASRLGYTRSYIYKRASDGAFKTLHRVGSQTSYVVNVDEVEELIRLKTERTTAKAEEEPASKLKASTSKRRTSKKSGSTNISAEKPVESAAEEKELSIEELLAQI